jgi:hypothetical protein
MPDAAFIDLQPDSAEYSIVALGIVLESGSSAAMECSGMAWRESMNTASGMPCHPEPADPVHRQRMRCSGLAAAPEIARLPR